MYKSSIIDVQIGSKYAFVSITLHLTFLEEHCFGKLMKCLKVLPEIKKKEKENLKYECKRCNWWLLLKWVWVLQNNFKKES